VRAATQTSVDTPQPRNHPVGWVSGLTDRGYRHRMTAILEPHSTGSSGSTGSRAPDSAGDADPVLAEARTLGFELATYESDAGQLIFEWRRGDEPRPQFVTRRVALQWMQEFLAGPRLRVG